jgi:RNA polymerase sigma factor for flagellar operon FliA
MQDAPRDKLAREHLDLVEKLVASMRRRFGAAADPDELRSLGMMGLASAINQYDPGLGVPFGAYASIRIKGTIYDGLAAAGWFPRRLSRQISFYRKADELLLQGGQDPPPVDRTETVHRLADRLRELATAYVTTYAAEDGGEPASAPAEAEFVADRRKYYGRVAAYVRTLPEAQRTVLQKFFYEDVALIDIAREMGCSKSWTSRLLRAALDGLREKFEDAPLSLDSFQPP